MRFCQYARALPRTPSLLCRSAATPLCVSCPLTSRVASYLFTSPSLSTQHMSALASARSLGRSSSLQLPEYASSVAPCVARPALHRPTLMQTRRSGRSLRVNAHMVDKVFATVQEGAKRFMGRYDPVATGVGSLVVTGYCVVVHQQPVEEALNIAAGATILGMVLQEVLFNHDQQSLN